MKWLLVATFFPLFRDDGVDEMMANYIESLAVIEDDPSSERTTTTLMEENEFLDAERTITALHASIENDNDFMDAEADVSSSQMVEDISPEDRIKQIISPVPAKMQELMNQESLEDVAKYVSMHRFLVTIEKLVELKGTFCKEIVADRICGSPLTFSHQYGKGTVLKLSWSCSNSHFGHWLSSEVLTSRNNNNVYVNDILVSSSVLLSGNNYTKYSLLCKALNQHIPSISSYSNVQKLYTSTVIMKFWNSMKSVVMEVLDKNAMCLSGDGRNDSPGHSARFSTYVLMEHFTELIVDFDVTDKRETKGISTNMQVHALKKLLLKLKDTMNIIELVTDASTSVAKLVRAMKGYW